MAAPNTTDSTSTSAGLAATAPKADASPFGQPTRAEFASRPFPDPTLLTSDERLAVFGRLLMRAVERRRSRLASIHSSKQVSKQKRN